MVRTAVAKAEATEQASRVDQILAVSANLFHQRGYADVSIRDIGSAAGLSTSTLYHYFKDKQEILFAISERFALDFNDAVIPATQGEGSPSERLRATIEAQIRFQHARGDEGLNGNHFRVALSDKQRRRCTGLWRVYRESVENLIKDGVGAGEFDVADANLTTQMILDMVTGLREWYAESGRHSIDSIVAIYGDAVLRLCGVKLTAAPSNGRRPRKSGRSAR